MTDNVTKMLLPKRPEARRITGSDTGPLRFLLNNREPKVQRPKQHCWTRNQMNTVAGLLRVAAGNPSMVAAKTGQW
jgi:hypothetical protein